MKFNSFFKVFLLGLMVVSFASCDKDFNEIGTDIVGDDHFGFEKYTDASVVAYNQNLGPVQTNNLPTNALGYYNNSVFGKTKASFVSQLELKTADPTFYDPANIVIDSVYLYVPYFSTFKEKNNDTGDSTYELDSIYGGSPVKLDVYESGYYLRDFDVSTGLQEYQKYYSNQGPLFDAAIVNPSQPLNNATAASENSEFEFSNKEIKLTYQDEDGETVVKERLKPGMFLNLNKTFFKNKIMNAPSGKLINNNVFKDYFRGLYFKVNNTVTSPNQGTLSLIDFSAGKIMIVYKDHTSATDTTVKRKTMEINLGGNTVNVFENESNANYLNAISNPNTSLGDEKLYVKGQNGSMTIIDLFNSSVDVKGYDSETGLWTNVPNLVADELDEIKANKWLINEVNLTFYVETNIMSPNGTSSTIPEPNRIYLYDVDNKKPLVDYSNDFSSGTSAKFNKLIYGGIRENEDVTNGRGVEYKFRITNHVRNLIKNDSTNVKLGLVLTEDIANVTNASLLNPIPNNPFSIKYSPVMSVINPLGTVLHGSNSNVPLDKRLKVEIYYTKPE